MQIWCMFFYLITTYPIPLFKLEIKYLQGFFSNGWKKFLCLCVPLIFHLILDRVSLPANLMFSSSSICFQTSTIFCWKIKLFALFCDCIWIFPSSNFASWNYYVLLLQKPCKTLLSFSFLKKRDNNWLLVPHILNVGFNLF